jgi:hypothetical protein
MKSRPGDKAFFIDAPGGTWGWATWKRAWDLYDYHVKGIQEFLKNKRLVWEYDLRGRCNNTAMLLRHIEDPDVWDCMWHWKVFMEKGMTLYSPYALTKNIGFGDEATHTPKGGDWWADNIDLSIDRPILMPDKVEPDAEREEELANVNYVASFRDRWKNCGFTPREIVKAVFWFFYRPLRYIEMIMPFGISFGIYKR